MMRKNLLISAGEPAGIAPEIIARTWQHYRKQNLSFAVLGDVALLAERGGISCQIIESPIEAAEVFAQALPVLNIPYPVAVIPGQPNKDNAAAVIRAIRQGAALCHQNEAQALVSAPIDKAVLRRAGFAYQGHTDFLAALDAEYTATTTHPVMMLAGPSLRCVPVSIHVALRDAITNLDAPSIIDTLRTVASALRRYWHIAKPKIAVSGLNPHAGEGGQMGDEEIRIIAPALEILRGDPEMKNVSIVGPLPADSMFQPAMRAQYDAFVTMTHDQALIPIKTLDFDCAVNITLGLSFVRTSPDHGTAYDLAGSERASATSMIAAVAEAARLA